MDGDSFMLFEYFILTTKTEASMKNGLKHLQRLLKFLKMHYNQAIASMKALFNTIG